MKVRIRVPEGSKVFLLEDNEERIKWFKSQYPEVLVAINVDEARKLLSTQKFDLFFLDHDLEEAHYESYNLGYDVSGDRSGLEIAAEIALENIKNYSNVIIHSWNHDGAKRMSGILPGSFLIPFGRFEIDVVSA